MIGGGTLGCSTLGHVGTRRDAKSGDTKSGTQNLGHKIWDRKMGTQNLGHKMGDKGDTTPNLRIGRDMLGYTTGHNGENGTQRDTTP